MFGANLVILAQICDDLWHGLVKFPRILSQNDQNDLEDQGQWRLFSKPTESIPGCMFGANLVIPAQICDELSCGQGKVYGQTVGQTDGQTQATTTPLRPERSRDKKDLNIPLTKSKIAFFLITSGSHKDLWVKICSNPISRKQTAAKTHTPL